MRLIDADELKRKQYRSYPSIDHYCLSRSVVDVEDIDNAPTIETGSVRRGHWIQGYIPNDDGSYTPIDFNCSVCGQANDVESNYCPNCGAKMIE